MNIAQELSIVRDNIAEYGMTNITQLEYDAIYQQGRADATNEIHTELITEIAMLNATKMTDTDLYAFAVRIKEITDK